MNKVSVVPERHYYIKLYGNIKSVLLAILLSPVSGGVTRCV